MISHHFSRGTILMLILSVGITYSSLNHGGKHLTTLSSCPNPAYDNDKFNCTGSGIAARSYFLLFQNKLNLNTASFEELRLVPKIKQKVAQAIIDARRLKGKFNNFNEIDEIKGVGTKTLDNLKNHTALFSSDDTI